MTEPAFIGGRNAAINLSPRRVTKPASLTLLLKLMIKHWEHPIG